jgi:hypothetical protein
LFKLEICENNLDQFLKKNIGFSVIYIATQCIGTFLGKMHVC